MMGGGLSLSQDWQQSEEGEGRGEIYVSYIETKRKDRKTKIRNRKQLL